MKTRPPVVGITRCSKLPDYISSVEQAGATARILEVSESPRELVSHLDGLVLAGGGDIDPVLYGEKRHATVEDAEPGRDEFEIDLARRARAAGLPVLAICRGAQVMNVAAGGSLVQDIPSALPATLVHAVAQPPDAAAHEVTLRPGSRLQRALGSDTHAPDACTVNSRHHQAVARIGEGLVASATAPDGVVEAIEAPDAMFYVGVQWHPENFWRTGEFRRLFDAFVTAARSRMKTSG